MNETANPARTGRTNGARKGATADDVFDALGASRRRNALAVLSDRGRMDVQALATAVARAEADGEGVGDDRVETVHVTLHHVHLPKLSDVGMVTYDYEEGVVAPTVTDLDVSRLGVEAGVFDAGR